MTGILTHHLDHDENVWAFLQSLFELTTNHRMPLALITRMA